MGSSRHRQQQMVEIYQDSNSTTYDSAPISTQNNQYSHPQEQDSYALQDALPRLNVRFTPPLAGSAENGPSPMKSSQQSESLPLSSFPPSHTPFAHISSMVPMPPPQQAMFPTDSIAKKLPEGQHMFTTFMASGGRDQENVPSAYPTYYSNQTTKADFPIAPNYGHKGTNKRTFVESAPGQEPRRPTKKSKASSRASQRSANAHDNGKKPGHSYAQLISMAIMSSPTRQLTLSQIYKWISDNYSFYALNSAGWQNSIRHNLSLHKAFVKQERPKDNPGKGHYWVLAPGSEQLLVQGKHGNKLTSFAGATAHASSQSTPFPMQAESQTVFQLNKPAEPVVAAPESSHYSQEPAAPAPGPSSDATIAEDESDAEHEEEHDEIHEGDQEGAATMPPPSRPRLASSPPPPMHSSPPISRHDSPPHAARCAAPSALHSHRRQTASLDDSGYLSAVSSSGIRRAKVHKHRKPERTTRKIRGRAEEEIARLRGSSYDSPSETAARPARPLGHSSHQRMESPPNRAAQHVTDHDDTEMLPPLTPAIKFDAPDDPPQSISPNANLRIHRQNVRKLIGSPLRDLTAADQNVPWSPEFHLGDESFYDDGDDSGCEGFADAEASTDAFDIRRAQSNVMNGSPEKKKARVSDEHGASSGDLPAATKKPNRALFSNLMTPHSAPFPSLTYTPHLQPAFGDPDNAPSPSKSPGTNAPPHRSPSKFRNAPKQCLVNPWGRLAYGEHAMAGGASNHGADEVGLDLLGGFQRIGSGPPSAPASSSFGSALRGGVRFVRVVPASYPMWGDQILNAFSDDQPSPANDPSL